MSDDALAFTFVEAIRAGRMDRHLTTVAAEARWRLVLIDPDRAPLRTAEMIRNHQVWVWLSDTPVPVPDDPTDWPMGQEPGPGRWEVRGTGLIL